MMVLYPRTLHENPVLLRVLVGYCRCAWRKRLTTGNQISGHHLSVRALVALWTHTGATGATTLLVRRCYHQEATAGCLETKIMPTADAHKSEQHKFCKGFGLRYQNFANSKIKSVSYNKVFERGSWRGFGRQVFQGIGLFRWR